MKDSTTSSGKSSATARTSSPKAKPGTSWPPETLTPSEQESLRQEFREAAPVMRRLLADLDSKMGAKAA